LKEEYRCRLLAFRVSYRNRTYGSFAEVLSFDSKRVIKARPVVLPRNARRKFDELRIIKMGLEPIEDALRYFDRRLGHGIGVLQGQLLNFAEMFTRVVVMKIGDLLRRNSVLSAHGRTDVDSKWAANQRSHPELRQILEHWRD